MPKRELIEEYMLVWENTWTERDALKRLVLFKNSDGPCVAVDDGDENKYFNGEEFDVIKWDNCKPLPKKTKRLMNEAEFMDLRKENPQIVFSYTDSRFWFTTLNTNMFNERKVLKYSLDLVNWNDFYVEVEE